MSVLLVHYLAVMLPASTTPATINPFAMAVAIMPLPRNPTVMPSVAIFFYFYAVAITPHQPQWYIIGKPLYELQFSPAPIFPRDQCDRLLLLLNHTLMH